MSKEKLRAARLKQGLTQLQVAQRANITVANYQRIEYGQQQPKVDTAKLIATALSSTVNELF